MEAMHKGAVTMKLIGELICCCELICRGMDVKEMQHIAAEFQREMMKNDINVGIMNDVVDGDVDGDMVDEEMDKVLFEVAGMKLSGLSWFVE